MLHHIPRHSLTRRHNKSTRRRVPPQKRTQRGTPSLSDHPEGITPTRCGGPFARANGVGMRSAWGRAEGRGEHVGHGLRPEAAVRKKLCGLRRTGKKAKLRDYTLVCRCRLCRVYRGRITVEFSYAPARSSARTNRALRFHRGPRRIGSHNLIQHRARKARGGHVVLSV
jgi:hypothetical protein